MQRAKPRAALELVLLTFLSGCHGAAHAEHRGPPAPSAPASAPAIASALVPGVRDAGRFDCQADECRQLHPHLPDTGEWRCAESVEGVWCAGGEPAAGVVPGAPDADFACGERWGTKQNDGSGERVCIDRHPAYPGDPRDYSCKFEQEHGTTRVCRRTSHRGGAAPRYAQRSPACWLDRDCPVGRCRAGACECRTSSDCLHGACNLAGLCEVTP